MRTLLESKVYLFVFDVNQRNERERGESKISLCHPRDSGASSQSFLFEVAYLVCVEYLLMIKPVVVVFCSIRD